MKQLAMMVWNVQLMPNPNLHGDFGVTLLRSIQYMNTLLNIHFVLER